MSRNTASDRRVPKIITNNGDRKSVPSFAGNINIGRLEPQAQDTRFSQAARPRPAPTTTTPQPVFNNFQQNQFRGQPRNQQQFQQRQPQFPQNQQQQFQFQQNQQQGQFSQNQQRPQFQQNQQQFQQRQPQQQPQFQQNQQPQQFQPRQPQQPQQQFQPQPAQPNSVGSQSIFDQIKARINREKAAKKKILQNQDQPQPQPQPQPQQNFRQQPQPQQNFRQQPQPQQNFRQQPQPQQNFQNNFGTFGVFEAVDLSSGPNPSPVPAVPTPARSFDSRQAENEGNFFGVFPEVNLQG